MSYKVLTYEEILQAVLTDYQNQVPGCDVSQGSDIYIKATALASVVWGIYQHQAWLGRQIFPDTADPESLERHAWIRGLARKAASRASGMVAFTGQDGTHVPVGMQAATPGGITVETTEAGDVAAGVLVLDAQSSEAGLSGNLALGAALAVQDPPPGLDQASEVADDGNGNGFTGGTDLETDAALLTRLLDLIRRPPAGGNAHDYEAWALSVPGVEAALVFPLRLGLGTVTTVILTSGSGAARIPNQTLVNTVDAYLDTVRPVTVKTCQVLAPTALETDVTVAVSVLPGYTAATVKGWVSDAITAYMSGLAPLDTLYLSRLRAVVADVEGVLDSTVSLPVANVVPVDDGGLGIEMITPGTITVGDL